MNECNNYYKSWMKNRTSDGNTSNKRHYIFMIRLNRSQIGPAPTLTLIITNKQRSSLACVLNG